MRIVNEGEVLVRKDVELVLSLSLTSPKAVVYKEGTLCPFGQAGTGSVVVVSWQWEGGEEQVDVLDLVIVSAHFVADWECVGGVRGGSGLGIEGPDCDRSVSECIQHPTRNPKC